MKNKILACLLVMIATVWGPSLFSQRVRTLSTIMREKLTHSHQLLEAVVMENFAAIEENAERMASLNREANWATTQSVDFTRYSAEFAHILDDLGAHARDQNLDAATLSYVDLTLKCVECHRHVRNVERVGLAPARPEVAAPR